MDTTEDTSPNNPIRSLGIVRPYTPGLTITCTETTRGITVVVARDAWSGSDHRRQRALSFFIRDDRDSADERGTLLVTRMVARALLEQD